MKNLTSYIDEHINSHINAPILRRYLMACPGTLTLAATFLPNSTHGCHQNVYEGLSVCLPASLSDSTDNILPGLRSNVGLHATLTDASNPTNTSNTLTLSGNSTATGVGIQMFRPGETTALGLGPDSSAKGNTNQWYVGSTSASGGTLNVPIVSKYVKTLPVIKPGSVSARSTITFSYQ